MGGYHPVNALHSCRDKTPAGMTFSLCNNKWVYHCSLFGFHLISGVQAFYGGYMCIFSYPDLTEWALWNFRFKSPSTPEVFLLWYLLQAILKMSPSGPHLLVFTCLSRSHRDCAKAGLMQHTWWYVTSDKFVRLWLLKGALTYFFIPSRPWIYSDVAASATVKFRHCNLGT